MFKICNTYCRYLLEDFMAAGGCGGVSDLTKVQWEDLWRSTGCFTLKKKTTAFYGKFHIVLSIKSIYEAFCVFAQVITSPQRRHVLETMAYNWYAALRSQQLVAPSSRPVAGHPVLELLTLHLKILSTSWRTPTLVMWWINLKSLGSWVKVSDSRPLQAGFGSSWGSPVALVLLGFQRAAVWVHRTHLLPIEQGLTACSVIRNIHPKKPKVDFFVCVNKILVTQNANAMFPIYYSAFLNTFPFSSLKAVVDMEANALGGRGWGYTLVLVSPS